MVYLIGKDGYTTDVDTILNELYKQPDNKLILIQIVYFKNIQWKNKK